MVAAALADRPAAFNPCRRPAGATEEPAIEMWARNRKTWETYAMSDTKQHLAVLFRNILMPFAVGMASLGGMMALMVYGYPQWIAMVLFPGVLYCVFKLSAFILK